MISLLFLSLLACQDFPPQGYDPVDITEEETGEAATAQVTWLNDGIQLEITNNTGLNFTKFGIAQNDIACMAEEGDEDSTGVGCWTGEDCLNGDIGQDGTVFNTCHNFGIRTEPLLLAYAEDGINRSLVDGEIVASNGQQTAFPDNSYEFLVTYYLFEAGGDCYRWGYNTEYYDGLNCNIVN
ncbi:MAG: hypothetical protein AAFV53_24065 [Myxococcota bacterium]